MVREALLVLRKEVAHRDKIRRLVRHSRQFVKKKARMSTTKSAFLNEIHKSHRAVKYASFGRSVVTMELDKVQEYRAQEAERAEQEKLKKIERLEKMSRRRGGANIAKDSNQQAALMANLQQYTSEAAAALARLDKSSVADRIRALKTSFPVTSSQRESNARKSKMAGGLKETTAKDITHVLQKNVHISMNQSKKHESNRTSKIRNNLKMMKKMNVQEVLNYAAGTAVYFGATLAFQSRHGGYLSYNNFADIKASAPKIVPSARFVVWNCDDLNDHGILRYGDAVWLQAGAHEVLGAQYSGGTINADGTRKLRPSLINCRHEKAFKAQQYGRWIVLNRENPSETLGDKVLHHDKIMLEQEWCYLASHTPYDSFMEKSHSFEDFENKESNDFFKPIEECTWRLHLVTLPSDDNADTRFREYLLGQAKEQIKFSAQDRRLKERILSGPLSRRISDSLRPEEVIKRHLPQAASGEATKLHMLKKFDQQKMRDFAKRGQKASSLKNIYGRHSLVYKNAKTAETALREKNCKQLDIQHNESRSSEDIGPKMSLQDTEDLYWDIATNVLADTRVWESLPASMEVYEDLDQSKREIAVRVIQKFMRNKLSTIFNWKRVMHSMDVKETSKLSNTLLYEASKSVKKSAIFGEEQSTEDETFITTGNDKAAVNVGRRVSKAGLGDDISPELARLQRVMNVEVIDDEEENKRISSGNVNRRKSSIDCYGLDLSRPYTAPLFDIEQDNELDAQEKKKLSRHERRTLLSSASTSSMHAANKARMLLRGNSQSNIATKDRPSSAGVSSVNEVSAYRSHGYEKEVPGHADARSRILQRFEPKRSKKEKFINFVKSFSKSQDPAFGLPQDVFDDPHNDVSISTSLSFLRASSSAPQIYSDIKTSRRSSKYMTKRR